MTADRHRSLKRWIGVAAFVALGLASSAQDLSGKFDKTVDYKLQQNLDLNAKIGPAKVSFVEFSNLGRGYGQGGIGGRMRPVGAPSDVSTTLRARVSVDNPGEEWELAVTLDFLDKSGKTIERFTAREKFEEESKSWNIDHQLLEYVVPLIARVKIHIEGRED